MNQSHIISIKIITFEKARNQLNGNFQDLAIEEEPRRKIQPKFAVLRTSFPIYTVNSKKILHKRHFKSRNLDFSTPHV